MPGYASVHYSASSAGADSFKFRASDGNSDSDEVTVTTNNAPAVNDPPTCWEPSSPVEVEIGDLPSGVTECFDEEGDELTITITQQPLKGKVEIVDPDMPGYVFVQYSADAEGADSFKFRASDGSSDSEVTVTTTNLPAVNDPPECGGLEQAQVEVGEPEGADPCFDAEGDELTISITQQPQKGTLEVVGQGTPSPSLRYTATSVGPDSFRYKASDGSSDSNVGTTTTVNVDTTAPQTAIDSGPSGTTRESSPTFVFSSSESGSSFECRLDSGQETDFEPCSSPKMLAALSDGVHRFEVRAIDPAGHTDQTPASRSFTIDRTPPQTTIDTGP